jgi:hypothetical protein
MKQFAFVNQKLQDMFASEIASRHRTQRNKIPILRIDMQVALRNTHSIPKLAMLVEWPNKIPTPDYSKSKYTTTKNKCLKSRCPHRRSLAK